MHRNYRPIRFFALIIALVWTAAGPASISAQSGIPNPIDHFGHDIGEDYYLATYTEMIAFWQKLESASDRMILTEIGTTEQGRTMWMAIISSPDNLRDLDRYKDISRRLSLAADLTDEQARALAGEGKAVIWIDGGLHATEVVGAQQEIRLVYDMVSRSDPETLRILDNVILLATITNPDGMDMVSDWYMRESDPLKRSTRGLPFLYQKYIGHDNNRDFYMVTQKESEAVARVLYREWFPQVVYNHHQTGPAGCVLFVPPFREPHSYNLDPLLVLGITTVGNAMHSRFAAENKPGSTMRDGAGYQSWWNGCLRCTPYFHNQIGILTEMIGSPTPMEIPFIPKKHLPSGDYPYPIAPQEWHLMQSIEYSQTANRAILDLASKLREDFLFNIYRMGKNSIERGSRDHWTVNPWRLKAVEEAIRKDRAQQVGSGRSRGYSPDFYHNVLHAPEARDPRAYILPSDQADFLTAGKFADTLIKNGVTVRRAGREFEAAGKAYPAGSLVIKTDQAFRPHIIDMFEPQVYPDENSIPNKPPRPPYDSAGYTLAFQMGVAFDRILERIEGPFEAVNGLIDPTPGKIVGNGRAGWLLDHAVNDSVIAVNRLLKSGASVFWLNEPIRTAEREFAAGAIYIPAGSTRSAAVQALAGELGLNFFALNEQPRGPAHALHPVRIGLWDRYGGSMPSGWVRWLLERFEFDFEVVFPQTLDAGDLNTRFDSLIFVSGAIPARAASEGNRYFGRQPKPEEIPAEYRHMLGTVTVKNTVPRLKSFLEKGGAILTIGSSTSLAGHLGLPLADALTETTPAGKIRSLPSDKFSVPGSLLRVKVDRDNPVAYGMPEHVDVYFNRSPVFRLPPEAGFAGIRPVAWFDNDAPLRSGYARGQRYLRGGTAVLAAPVGRGRLILCGPEITFRAQPHGNFKFLFNGIFLGSSERTTL